VTYITQLITYPFSLEDDGGVGGGCEIGRRRIAEVVECFVAQCH